MLWIEGMWSVQVHIDQNKLCPSQLTTTNSIMHIASSSFAASQLHLLIYFTNFFVAKRTQKELWMMKKGEEIPRELLSVSALDADDAVFTAPTPLSVLGRWWMNKMLFLPSFFKF